jgi:hypothetical protein
MKRAVIVLAVAAFAAAPAAAQWAGMPVWNSPKGGTGITVYGDYGHPNTDAGKGNAFGARASLGLANLTLTAGVVTWKPEGFNSASTGVGGQVAFRAIGGSLIPVALNLQLGAGTFGSLTSGTTSIPKATEITAGAGVAASVPTPGVSIEPFLSVTNRWHKLSGVSGTNSHVGWTLGANLGFGMFGVHVAYDSEKLSTGGTAGIIGVGAHVALKVPMGM